MFHKRLFSGYSIEFNLYILCKSKKAIIVCTTTIESSLLRRKVIQINLVYICIVNLNKKLTLPNFTMFKPISPIIYFVFIVPFSYLPFSVLYFLSNILYLFIYHIVGYRKNVVRQNLQLVFPSKTDHEIKTIEKQFYKHFSDFLVESVKSINISEKEILKRCKITNLETVNKFFNANKSVLVLCGHYNNWEYYALGLAQQMKHKTQAVYQPLNNKFFNKKIKKIREKFGIKMIAIKEIVRVFSNTKNELTMTVVVNDQSPSNLNKAYWNTFLGIETAWMIGIEKLAKKYNYPVLFGCIKKTKRGYYEVTFEEISNNPKENKPGEILDKHTHFLEENIKEKPEYWLWSHRRWKHNKKI